MSKHVAPPTREAAIAEASAKYNASWASINEYKETHPDFNQQLVSMTGNSIRREYDADLDAAYRIPRTEAL